LSITTPIGNHSDCGQMPGNVIKNQHLSFRVFGFSPNLQQQQPKLLDSLRGAGQRAARDGRPKGDVKDGTRTTWQSQPPLPAARSLQHAAQGGVTRLADNRQGGVKAS
jgi:hypothetical protein